jgi:hypothetical protein
MSLLDTFMPNDLCARCDLEEAHKDFFVTAVRDFEGGEESARLAFCGQECKDAFVQGWHSILRFPIG